MGVNHAERHYEGKNFLYQLKQKVTYQLAKDVEQFSILGFHIRVVLPSVREHSALFLTFLLEVFA